MEEQEAKYSRTQFEGFTHRFIVKFETSESSHNLDIYSDSSSYITLEEFVNKKKSKNVISFEIIHRASKEQDEIASQLIDETLKDL